MTNPDNEHVPDPFGSKPPNQQLEERIVSALKGKGLIKGAPIRLRMRVLYGAAVAGLIAIAFMTGTYFNNSGGQTMSTTNRQYLLLVYNSPGFEEGDGHTAEYGAWFREYNKEGLLTGGEELDKHGYTLKSNVDNIVNFASNVISGNEGHISGFFLINAPTDEKAKEIAATCPHLKHNGTLELRPIKN